MRAATPTHSSHVERSGIRLGYEVFGDGDPTILLMPTWTIIHSRFWKMQVPYLSRHYRVVTYDGPGNGRSDRTTDPERYSADSYAADARAVMDECGVDRAVVVGLSLGAGYGARLATTSPESVAGLVMIGPSIPLTPQSPDRQATFANFEQAPPDNPKGWEKYNRAYWHVDYSDFTRFFFSQCFPEAHSTKAIEDSVGWAGEAGAAILEAEAATPAPVESWPEIVARVGCPTLVIHGTRDQISPHERGREAARLAGGRLVSIEGAGHIPNVRDPVRVNLAIRHFVDRIAP